MLSTSENSGFFFDTTEITIVPAPGPGITRIVTSLSFSNLDDAASTPIIRVKDLRFGHEDEPDIDGNIWPNEYRLLWPSRSIAALGSLAATGRVAVLTERFAIVGELSAAKNTDSPSYAASWLDEAGVQQP